MSMEEGGWGEKGNARIVHLIIFSHFLLTNHTGRRDEKMKWIRTNVTSIKWLRYYQWESVIIVKGYEYMLYGMSWNCGTDQMKSMQ